MPLVYYCGRNGEKHENLQILAIAFFNGYGNNFSWRGDSDETAPKEPQAGGDYILVEPPQPMRVAAESWRLGNFLIFPVRIASAYKALFLAGATSPIYPISS